MDRDQIIRQGKQTAADLRDTVSAKVSENEGTIKGTLGKAARWVDEKTGGKYHDQIGKVESKVGEGIGWVAAQSPSTPASGTPGAPGASAGDPAPGSAAPSTTPPGPVTPQEGGHAAAPHAAASPDSPTPPSESAPGTTPPGPVTPDDGDLPPRPPRV